MSSQLPANGSKYAGEDGLYCTAGKDYFYILPNGDVYRCMSDHLNNGPVFFNAQDGWVSDKGFNRCPYNVCFPRCDMDWTSRFRVKNEEVAYEGKSVNTALTTDGGAAPHIMWFPTLVCNYTCIYCPCGKGKASVHREMRSSNPELSLDQWIKIWSQIMEVYDYATIDISGGEPTISPALIPVLQMITTKFNVAITSNISQNVMVFGRDGIRLGHHRQTRYGAVRSGLTHITCSLHPNSRGFDLEKYKGNILYLNSLGINVTISYVGYPTQLFLADEHKNWAEKHGIGFNLLPWRGMDNIGYMTQYNKKQIDFINAIGGRYTESDFFSVSTYDYDMRAESNIIHNVGESVLIKGAIRNTGNMSWDSNQTGHEFKIGLRLYLNGSRGRDLIREMRAPLPPIVPVGAEEMFEISIATGDFTPGHYVLVVDVVKEYEFWMTQKGATERSIPLVLRQPEPAPEETVEAVH